jgi:hypothetical protein
LASVTTVIMEIEMNTTEDKIEGRCNRGPRRRLRQQRAARNREPTKRAASFLPREFQQLLQFGSAHAGRANWTVTAAVPATSAKAKIYLGDKMLWIRDGYPAFPIFAPLDSVTVHVVAKI